MNKIITRGLATRTQNWLCTRGYELIHIYPGGGLFVPEELGLSHRTKRLELCYDLHGILSCYTAKEYEILGVTQFAHKDIYLLKGLKKFETGFFLSVVGAILFEFEHDRELRGQVLSIIERDILVEGVKKFLIDNRHQLIGTKSIDLNEVMNIHGIKKISLLENIDVKGKKDITNILESLDLL